MRGINKSRRQAVELDVLRIAREDARQPIASRTLDPAFVKAGVFHRLNARDELTAHPVVDHQLGGLLQRCRCPVGARRLESGAEQRGHVVVAVHLDVERQLPKRNKSVVEINKA